MIVFSGVARDQNMPGHKQGTWKNCCAYLWLHVVLRANFYPGPSKFYLGQARVGSGVATSLILLTIVNVIVLPLGLGARLLFPLPPPQPNNPPFYLPQEWEWLLAREPRPFTVAPESGIPLHS